MKISELINKLQSIQDKHGDHIHVTVEPVTTEILLDKHFNSDYYNIEDTSITDVELIDDLGCSFLRIEGENKATIPMKYVRLSSN